MTFSSSKPIIIFLSFLAIVGLGIIGTAFYQKSQQPVPKALANLDKTAIEAQPPAVGDVTALTETSISVTDRHTGGTKTFAITDKTEFIDSDENKLSRSDINVGGMVVLFADPGDAAKAARVMIHPNS